MAEPSSIVTAAIPAITAGVNAISRGGPRRQFKWGKKMIAYQNEVNRANAEWTLAQNRAILEEQRAYDSPSAKMARLKAAGLNPFLAYEGVGQMNSPMINMNSLPAANMGHIDTSYGNIGSEVMDAALAQTQMGMTNQKIEESKTKQALIQAQEELVKANPQMRPAYVDALVKQVEATAALKQQEKRWSEWSVTDPERGYIGYQQGYIKMDKELELLFQKYNLNNADQKVKAQIIESKDWENDIKEIQSKWLKDGEITPQHIYQGLMMLLMKLR
jgi:hypothetical protein